MNCQNQPLSKKLCIATVMLVAALLATVGEAQVINLSEGNATATVDITHNTGDGMDSWNVNGVSQLAQQWFWYRVGSGGPQAVINTISTPSYFTAAAGPTASINYLSTTYANASYDITIEYTLHGGATGHSDMMENITIDNSSASQLVFHFFQYSDFNLAGTSGGESVLISGSPGGWYQARQTKGPLQIAETITQPYADHAEAAFAGPGGTKDKLNSINGYNLNENPSAGIGDVTWAYEWDLTLNPGDSANVVKDKVLSVQPVPEPSVFALIALGLGAIALRRRGQP